MKKARLNVIDVSFALQAQTMRRNRDGIHWSPASNRWEVSDCMMYDCEDVTIFLQTDDPPSPHPPHPHLASLRPSLSSGADEEQRLLNKSHSPKNEEKTEKVQ